jgi:hypothetical protein
VFRICEVPLYGGVQVHRGVSLCLTRVSCQTAEPRCRTLWLKARRKLHANGSGHILDLVLFGGRVAGEKPVLDHHSWDCLANQHPSFTRRGASSKHDSRNPKPEIRQDKNEGWGKLQNEMGLIMDGYDGLHYKGAQH